MTLHVQAMLPFMLYGPDASRALGLLFLRVPVSETDCPLSTRARIAEVMAMTVAKVPDARSRIIESAALHCAQQWKLDQGRPPAFWHASMA